MHAAYKGGCQVLRTPLLKRFRPPSAQLGEQNAHQSLSSSFFQVPVRFCGCVNREGWKSPAATGLASLASALVAGRLALRALGAPTPRMRRQLGIGMATLRLGMKRRPAGRLAEGENHLFVYSCRRPLWTAPKPPSRTARPQPPWKAAHYAMSRSMVASRFAPMGLRRLATS